MNSNKPTQQLTLTVCIVVYQPDLIELERTLRGLRDAISMLEQGSAVRITVVDNNLKEGLASWIIDNFSDLSIELLAGHGNVGYGRANNMTIEDVGTFHLVLNPDVAIETDALANAIVFMNNNSSCGLITPLVFGNDGKRQFLCKRFPSLLDLSLRGFAPRSVRGIFAKRLRYYEIADMRIDQVYWNPPIVSGCFMFFRGHVFRRLAGFDPSYFLYFEDFDISLRAGRLTNIAFVPTVKIKHSGGDAGGKGLWHIYQFLRSAITFYKRHGLRVW